MHILNADNKVLKEKQEHLNKQQTVYQQLLKGEGIKGKN